MLHRTLSLVSCLLKLSASQLAASNVIHSGFSNQIYRLKGLPRSLYPSHRDLLGTEQFTIYCKCHNNVALNSRIYNLATQWRPAIGFFFFFFLWQDVILHP